MTLNRSQENPVLTSSSHSRLDATLTRLEARIEEALDNTDEARVTAEDLERLYGLRGPYRRLSESLAEHAKRVSAIEGPRLREESF